MSSWMIVNTHSLIRATVSPVRAQVINLFTTSRSMLSPASWPRLSLTSLKWSRSIKRSAVTDFLRLAFVIANWIRSRKSARLGSSVSLSWNAWCFISCVLSIISREETSRDLSSRDRSSSEFVYVRETILRRFSHCSLFGTEPASRMPSFLS